MGIILNRRRVMGGKSLPYDAEIEYLESSGTQYIELPYPFDNTDFVELEAILKFIGVDAFLVTSKRWADKGSNRFSFAGIGSGAYYGFYYGSRGTGNIFVPNTVADNNVHLWRYQNYICQIVDLGLTMDVSNIPFAGTTTNLVLFWKYNGASPGIIRSFKHRKATGEILDLIPVRVGNVGYMYDKVSKQLFGNSGTGAFILGPDKGIKNVSINVKTHNISAASASIDVTTGDSEPVNISWNTNVWTNGYIIVTYRTNVGWKIFALTPCLYNGQVYNEGDLIAAWVYTETRDINIVGNI